MKIFRSLFAFGVFSFLLIANSSHASAISLSPDTGSIGSGETMTINITANPPVNSTAVQLRISVDNATIVSPYTAPTSNWLSIGTCNSAQDQSTTGEICVDIARTSGIIQQGEDLGSFVVQAPSASGTIAINANSDNGYLVDSATPYIENQVGQIGVYTVGVLGESTGPTTLPNTAFGDVSKSTIIITGLVLVVFGLVAYKFQIGTEFIAKQFNRFGNEEKERLFVSSTKNKK